MRHLLRRSTVLLTAVFVVLATTAESCDDDSTPAGDAAEEAEAQPVEEAVEESEGESVGETASAEEPGDLARRIESGVGDSGTAHVAMRIDGPVEMLVEGDTEYGPKVSATDVRISTPDLGEKPARMILADKKAFMALPGVTPKGKWFVIPASSKDFGGLLDAGGSVQMDGFTSGFEDGVAKVTPQGEKSVGGQSYAAYRLRMDPKAYLDAVGESPAGAPKKFGMNLLLDDLDRPRRMSYSVGGNDVVVDFTQWGEPLDIEAPTKGARIALPAPLR